MDGHLNTNCEDVARLLPRWSDGELSAARGDLVRGHLLDCRECRARYGEQRNLERWMVAPEAPAVPEGFAERVTRLAAASGVRPLSLPTPKADVDEVDVIVPAPPATEPVERDAAGSMLSFVLACTAVAAAMLLGLALALGQQDRPTGEELRADPLSESQLLQLFEEEQRWADSLEADDTEDSASR